MFEFNPSPRFAVALLLISLTLGCERASDSPVASGPSAVPIQSPPQVASENAALPETVNGETSEAQAKSQTTDSSTQVATDSSAGLEPVTVSEEAAESQTSASGGQRTVPPNVDQSMLGGYLPTGGSEDVEDLTMPDDPTAPQPPPDSAYAEIVTERKKMDETVWKNEVLAQEHEQTFTWLWDRMLSEPDHFRVLKEFPFDSLDLPQLELAATLDWGIEVFRSTGGKSTVLSQNWPEALKKYEGQGFRLVDSEWHHLKFDPSSEGAPAKSTVNYTLYVDQPEKEARYQIKGNLVVTWSGNLDDQNRPIPANIDASDVTIHTRAGKPAFEIKQSAAFPVDKQGKTAPTTLHPIMMYDFNDDGASELVIGGYNSLFWNDGKGNFKGDHLVVPNGPKHTNAGLVADLNGDTFPELVLGLKSGPIVCYWGDKSGRYASDRRSIVEAVGKMIVPSCIAAGDIDGDNDLDLYITQLRPPYLLGRIPVPFFDANDGFPAYLLLNDGQGGFSDVTDLAGLGPKRFRRTFSATFLDLDRDQDQDLIVVSDFSGLDVYFNNGKGGFDDVTTQVAPDRSAFGMSHTFGDYDLDGSLDFYMIGMSSTTARRLDHMGLRRDDKDTFFRYADMRQHMGYGNRMFLTSVKPEGVKFAQAPWNNDVARTGWSWGSTTLDFDNDSDPDVFVANGQLSGKTTKDYCTRFWCHDIYIGNKVDDPGVTQLINEISPKLGGNGVSWNGFEHDALFMNLGGQGFVNIAYLMGCDLVYDGRCVVSDDIDLDGRMDLIVEQTKARESQDVIHVLRNTWDQGNHWIGFRIPEGPPGLSPIGTQVAIEFEDGTRRIGTHLVGHSVWTQHSSKIHFGLGKRDKVKSATIRWPNGQEKKVENPDIDQYHRISFN